MVKERSTITAAPALTNQGPMSSSKTQRGTQGHEAQGTAPSGGTARADGDLTQGWSRQSTLRLSQTRRYTQVGAGDHLGDQPLSPSRSMA